MAKFCSQGCNNLICDFCWYHIHNQDDRGVVFGDGICLKHGRFEPQEGGCEDFDCFNNHKVDGIYQPPLDPEMMKMIRAWLNAGEDYIDEIADFRFRERHSNGK